MTMGNKVPDAVLQLLKQFPTQKDAADALGVHLSTLGKVVRGERNLSNKLKTKIEEALAPGLSRPSLEAPAKRGPGGSRTKTIYDDPPLLKKLIDKFHGKRNRAAAALGYATPSLINDWGSGRKPFDENAMKRVERALNGEPPPSDFDSEGEQPDAFKTGHIYSMFPAATFELAFDTAESLSGKCVFKMPVKELWFGVFKMQSDKAKLFKRLMARHAMKITCP